MDVLEKQFSANKDFKNPFALSKVVAENPNFNLIKSLFNGQTESVISCRDVKFESKRKESFLDIQLSLKNMNTKFFCLENSLIDFLRKEPLVDDNKYDTEVYGKQDADKRVRFVKLPKILMFHLRRCEFDYMTEINKKIKHRFEFPEVLQMDSFKDPEFKKGDGHSYKLFGIFVHHGQDGLAGHYTVLLNGEEGWFEFDDECAKKVDWEYVKKNSFGGDFEELIIEKKQMRLHNRKKKALSHAYMLLYIDQRYERGTQIVINPEPFIV